MIILGLCMGTAGAWLGTTQAPLEVGVDNSGYHLGGTLLKNIGPGSYGGNTAVVIRSDNNQVRGGAVGMLGRDSMRGKCTYLIRAAAEECAFTVGTKHFHAHDRLEGGAWHRVYDDGRRLELKLADPARPSPVPVPIAWE